MGCVCVRTEWGVCVLGQSGVCVCSDRVGCVLGQSVVCVLGQSGVCVCAGRGESPVCGGEWGGVYLYGGCVGGVVRRVVISVCVLRRGCVRVRWGGGGSGRDGRGGIGECRGLG